jgi:acyl-coenzyme A synthetase/AMP-(fatty) acid ligase
MNSLAPGDAAFALEGPDMDKLKRAIEGVLGIDPSAAAVEFEQRWTSWGDIARTKSQIDALLAPLGPDVRVGVLIRNRPPSVAAILAVATSGDCLVTLNPVYPDDKLGADLESCAPPVIVGEAQDWARPTLADAAAKLGALTIELTGDAANPVRLRTPMAKALHEFARPRHDGVAVEMLTSGTTGAPKRIPLRAEPFELSVLAALNFESKRNESDAPALRNGVTFATAPLAHIGGLMGIFNAVIAGRKVFMLERFDVAKFHEGLRRHKPKVVSSPPAALRMLLDAKLPREDFSSLSAYRTGTAPLDPDLADAFFDAYGVPVLQNYGATEFGGVAGWTIGDFHKYRKDKRGSVGRLNPGIEGRAVDQESLTPLPTGERGVLQLKGKQVGDGQSWVTTTDLARLDEDGFLFILGRADNAIIRGGFKVHPDDIVNALQQHEAILEAAVVALSDERLGQVPAAAYLLKSGAADPGSDALATFLRAHLAPYQIPVRFMALTEFPRTISMKVSQPDLRSVFESRG